MIVRRNLELYHHGIKGQRWGVKNGPPYPLGSDESTGKRLKVKNEKKFYKKSKEALKDIIHQPIFDIKELRKIAKAEIDWWDDYDNEQKENLYHELFEKYMNKVISKNDLYNKIHINNLSDRRQEEAIKNIVEEAIIELTYDKEWLLYDMD